MAGPVYTYTLCTPDAASPMNQTTTLIRDNFQAINELVEVNHVTFNTASTYGMHSNIKFPFQSSLPITDPTDINLFSEETPSGPNAAELFALIPDLSAGNQISKVQISAVQPGGGIPGGSSGSGYCTFSTSGAIMKWGTTTVTTLIGGTGSGSQISAGALAIVNYPTGPGIPVFTRGTAYIKVTPTSILNSNDLGSLAAFPGTSGSGSAGIGKTTFTVKTVYPATFSITWFAIGV